MRAPIYNDRGQFRYSDFVGYIPEYLKSEPDVVAMLQVFSDYINNAYRNIETIEKFEFSVAVRADRMSRAMRAMEYLRTMLELAGSRNDAVNLLSVPRANIKNNSVFGRKSGYYPHIINYNAPEIVDTIDRVSRLDGTIVEYGDGDVVFVNYEGLEDGEQEVAYYYDKDSDALHIDQMGTTQDPFTGTYNTSDRMISFHVSDVSQVSSRYGYTSEHGVQYNEIFFNARIYDVSSVPALKETSIPGGVNAILDMYDVGSTPAGKLRTTIRFDGEDGWSWRNGYPTSIMYLSDTSGANLASLSGEAGNRLPLGKCIDPQYADGITKYAVIGAPEIVDGGYISVVLGTPYPSYSNSIVYLATKKNLNVIGEFTLIMDSRENGRLDVKLIPTGKMPDFTGMGELVLLDIPLFYGRGTLDYSQSSPLVKIGNTYPLDVIDEDGLNIKPDAGLQAFACTATENQVVGTLNIVSKDSPDRTYDQAYMESNYVIVVPFSSDLATNYGKLYDLGDSIYIDGGYKYWDGLGIVSGFERRDDGYAITLQALRYGIRPHKLDEPVTVRVAKCGYITVVDDPDNPGSTVISTARNESALPVSSLISDNGSIVLLFGTLGTFAARIYPDNVFDRPIPADTYVLKFITETNDRVRDLIEMDMTGDSMTTVWKRSRGDMFTRPYVMLHDTIGNRTVGEVRYEPGEKVYPLVPGNYMAGQYVYDPVTKRVYKCIEDCTVTDINAVSSNNKFTEDRIVHYSIPYVERFNAFMPYYGPVCALGYGETIDYSIDPASFTSPLYITKVEDKSLKYGWEHREFMNYGEAMNLSGRDRNGMVEFHTTERTYEAPSLTVDHDMDIVDSDLFERATWSYPHSIVTHGCAGSIKVDIDDAKYLAAERSDNTTWKVTVHSAAHGLTDGSLVSVSGVKNADVRGVQLDFNVSFVPVTVIDGDVFSYCITGNSDIIGKVAYADLFNDPDHPDKMTGSIVYLQDHHVRIAALSYAGDRKLSVMFADKVHVVNNGDMLYLENCFLGGNPFNHGPYEVIEVNTDYTGLTINCPSVRMDPETGKANVSTVPVPGEHAILRKPISEGDVVAITNADDYPVGFYRVENGMWPKVDRTALITPFILFSQSNLFDITDTNPAIAVGDPITISSITYTGNDTAHVILQKPIPHFTNENRRNIEGKTKVYISNVTPTDFNGLHSVTKIYNSIEFDISMRLYNTYATKGMPMGDLTMELRECRWYRYLVDEIEWDRVSSQASYTAKNTTTLISNDDSRCTVKCLYDHNLSVGDYVVLGYDFTEFDETTGLNGYGMGRVTQVINNSTVEFEIVFGEYGNTMSIARGIITLPGMDNIAVRNGEYSMKLESLRGTTGTSVTYRFNDGDIVMAAGQDINSERLSYLVRKNAQWQVLKRKRIVKIRKATVDEYVNGEYLEGNSERNLDEYVYATYSDVDVAKASSFAYATRMFMIRNPNFANPSIEDLDTTRNPYAEYSSGEDFANIAPRDDMKSSFKGIPDMKYPLIEKIERLAYLRDANVIDFELIGYLARFMGYDITAMADDIKSSNLYRTIKQQEAAVREAVMNLPQYYSLGGTYSGLKMLMATFGIIGDVLTLYTNTMNPYEEMINLEEVKSRLIEDSSQGNIRGSWVSTPYIDIALTDDSRFPQFSIQPDDISRIKEQIRVWKPINVVFRDILVRYVSEIDLRMSLSGPIVGITEFGAAISLTDGNEDVAGSIEFSDPELTNCAF